MFTSTPGWVSNISAIDLYILDAIVKRLSEAREENGAVRRDITVEHNPLHTGTNADRDRAMMGDKRGFSVFTYFRQDFWNHPIDGLQAHEKRGPYYATGIGDFFAH